MTAAELYVRDGSRFVRVEDDQARTATSANKSPTRAWPSVARVAPLLVDVPPIPVPVPVDDEPDERPNVHRVHAPKCAHGHFARWAARNCRPCAREESRRAR